MRDRNEMRIGLGQFSELTDEKLAFIKQLGADDFLMNTPRLPGEQRWEYDDLLALRTRADAAELRLMCLENVPVRFYDRAMLGLPGRDRQIANMQATIRNMGRAGSPSSATTGCPTRCGARPAWHRCAAVPAAPASTWPSTPMRRSPMAASLAKIRCGTTTSTT